MFQRYTHWFGNSAFHLFYHTREQCMSEVYTPIKTQLQIQLLLLIIV